MNKLLKFKINTDFVFSVLKKMKSTFSALNLLVFYTMNAPAGVVD